MSAPKRIFLQAGEEYQPGDPLPDGEEVTWSVFREFDADIEYVLASDYDALAERAEKLYRRLRDVSINDDRDVSREAWCSCCGQTWRQGERERHSELCLAAPSAPKEAP